MSNIVAIDNFTVTSQEFVIPGGELITSTVPQASLTLTPNQGYQIAAGNFLVKDTSSPEVDWENSIFTQDGENVILTVLFKSDAVMPNSNLDIKICMRGGSSETNVQVSGGIVYTTANSSPSGVANYINTGAAETSETIFSQKIEANPGYYFANVPTITLTKGNSSNYRFFTKNLVYSSVNGIPLLVEATVNAEYTYPFINVADDVINVVGNAIVKPILQEYVTGYSVNTEIPFEATTINLAILGVVGAQYEISITGSATFSNNLSTITGTVSSASTIETIDLLEVSSEETNTLSFNLNYPAGDSNLDPSQGASYWTTVINRVQAENITISGLVNKTSSDITVDNSGATSLLDAYSSDLQTRNFTHVIAPSGGTSLSIAWVNTSNLAESDFTITPSAAFSITNATKQTNPDGSLQLNTTVQTAETEIVNMDYALTNPIESLITKTYTCINYEFNATTVGVDMIVAYVTCAGVETSVTVPAETTLGVCGKITPAPFILQGSGTITPTTNC